MNNKENKVLNHVHCPRCLEGVLELRAQETICPNADNAMTGELTNDIFWCGRCFKIYMRQCMGRIDRVFDSNAL